MRPLFDTFGSPLGISLMTHRSVRKGSRVINKRLSFECLEERIVLSGITDHSAAFDLIDLYEMRRQREYAEIDGDGIGIAIIDTGIDISPVSYTHLTLPTKA